jgi:anti-sigma factor ChrR (cupin superfamily)
MDGNFRRLLGDNLHVDCDTCREALSARADGEIEPVPGEETDAHLASCVDCRQWQEDAAALIRSLRVRPAAEVPDLTAAVLAACIPGDGAPVEVLPNDPGLDVDDVDVVDPGPDSGTHGGLRHLRPVSRKRAA